MKKQNLKKALLSAGLLLALLLTAFPPFSAAEAQKTPLSGAISAVCTVDGQRYMTDRYDRAIYCLEDGKKVLLIGRTDATDAAGRPVSGYRDGSFTEASFSEPWGMIPWQDGLLIADRDNHVLRYANLTKSRIYTYAGSGEAALRDGSGKNAAFASPTSLAVGDDGAVYISDSDNHAIRRLDKTGKVTTYIGGTEGDTLGTLAETRLSYPAGLCFADGKLYIADAGNHRILQVENGVCTLLAGAPLTGDKVFEGDCLNGPATLARFSSPMAVTAIDDTVYVADTGNAAIRVIRDGYVTTLPTSFTTPLIAPDAFFALDGTVYLADSFHRITLPLPLDTAEPAFTDTASSPHADAIRLVAANGLMNGTAADKFSPEETVTRGMILTVLARHDGMDTSAGQTWYDIGVKWGLDTGVSDGTAPESNITFEQLLTMLHRYAGKPSAAKAAPDSVSDYAKDAVAWALENDLLPTADLLPQVYPTRGETAAILEAFLLIS